MAARKNVLGTELQCCCKFPMTGFYRDGYCRTGTEDLGLHTVCVKVTEEFLAFSRAAGNDLTTPHPTMDFSGLIPGDKWCLCAARWQEAFEAGAAPEVILEATDEATLAIVRLEDLQRHAANGETQDWPV